MTIRSLALKSGETTAEDHRIILGALLGGATGDDALNRRSGIFHDPGAADLGGDELTATVAPFVAAVRGGSTTQQGTYLVASTEDIEVELEDGPPDGDRTDILGVVVRDDMYDGTGDTEAEVRVIDPESDVSYLPLFEIIVPQQATAGEGGIDWPDEPGGALPDGIEDLRDYTAGSGGVVSVPDAAARDRMERVRTGMLVHVQDSDDLHVQTDDGWHPVSGPSADEDIQERLVPRIEVGRVISMTADEEIPNDFGDRYFRGFQWVDFPGEPFAEPPEIFVTANTSVPGRVLEITIHDRSETGFRLCIARKNSTSFGVSWLAMGATTDPIDLRSDPDTQPDADLDTI